MTSSSSSGKKVLVINGPNLNLLGTREPEKYGSTKLEDVIFRCNSICTDAGATLLHFQSNHEGAIIDRIHAAREEGICGIVINAGALTHTSVGLRDALTGVNIKFLEVHISNVHAREPFRHHSYLSDKAAGILVGLGVPGYYYAVQHCLEHF